MDKKILNNPKRTKLNDKSINTLYEYYAGFSADFVLEKINSNKLLKNSTILDPWNGTGTTTSVSSLLGYNSIGVDLNPVMCIIATAKLSKLKDVKRAERFINEIKVPKFSKVGLNDPLCNWFSEESASSIRGIQRFISKNIGFVCEKKDDFSYSQAIIYLGLFKSVRGLLVKFIPSNPTWIKKAKNREEKIDIEFSDFLKILKKQVTEICEIINNNLIHEKKNKSTLLICSSTKLPLRDQSVDFVLSSPPYCTRIDYAVATLPELSVLFNTNEEIDSLRRSLMGTTTVPKNINNVNKFGKTCNSFLEQVSCHESRASKSYYYKNLHQYFNDLKESISEISRVLKENSKCILVVQDSYYKDIYCDLHKIISEMMHENNLYEINSVHFTSNKNMANINTKSKRYVARKKATESVLTFIKEVK
ncbi:DNA methyltransferase [Pantoea sp. SIMBA_072]